MRQTIRDLVPYIRNYYPAFLIGIAALVVHGLAATQVPLIVGNAIDAFRTDTGSWARMGGYIAAVLGVTALAALSMVVVRRAVLNASWEIQFDIRRDLFAHFTKLDNEYYDNNRIGDLMARLTADLNAVRMLVGVAIYQGINILLMVAFTLTRMFMLNVNLTLLTLIVAPFIALSLFLLLRAVHRLYQRVQEQFSNVSAMAQENFSGIRVVKGFGIESREQEAFERLNQEFIRRNLALTKVDGALWPLTELLVGLAVSLLLLVGGRYTLGVGSSLSVGEFAAFVLLFEGIQWPLVAFGWIGNLLQRGATSWGRLREILDHRQVIRDDEETDYGLRTVKGHIEFRDVTLRYGDQNVLDGVSFKIRAGERIGITGRTGAGKTMIVNLIARLIEPTTGQILIDGIDIRRYPLEVLRRNIGIVPQEPFLFSDSIAENIAFGIPKQDPETLRAKVREVAELVQLAGDVEDFPDGFDTSLGERGVTLSGGQRQRTAMARAIIRDPQLLILDDALSAVDTQTEARILRGLKTATENRTTLIVAHRVSAFQYVDRILVLEDGRIIEEGSHEELIAQGGWYADMDRRQQLEESLEAA